MGTPGGLNRVPRIRAAVAAALARQDPKPTSTEYALLVEKVIAGDLTVDFRALRLAWVRTSLRNPREGDDLSAMRRASEEGGEYKQAFGAVQKMIEAGFPNTEAHLIAAEA